MSADIRTHNYGYFPLLWEVWEVGKWRYFPLLWEVWEVREVRPEHASHPHACECLTRLVTGSAQRSSSSSKYLSIYFETVSIYHGEFEKFWPFRPLEL